MIVVASRVVAGVVFGTHDVAQIEELARRDPETGETEPEVVRIVSFGLAHYTESLWNLRGAVTAGKTLREVVAQS